MTKPSPFPIPVVTKRPIDVICMGRVAVDFYADDIGFTLADATTFKKYLGGCAGNIAIGTARLGLNSMMFSCVGQDEMGRFITETLNAEKVRTDLLYTTPDHLTGLVILGVKPPRDFPLIFYRENCADMQLKPVHISTELLAQAKALLITGTGLSKTEIRLTTRHAIDLARTSNTAIIFDLDYRPVLWGLTAKGNGENRYINNANVSTIYQQILSLCHLIVGTEEEFCLAGNSDNLTTALQTMRKLTTACLVVKLGEKGCVIYPEELTTPIIGQAFPVNVLNVLGAGDAFMSGLLRAILRNESWQTAAKFANACGALVVTRHGCAPAMPSWPELEYFINTFPAGADKPLTQLHTATTFQGKAGILIKRPQGFAFGVNSIVNMATAAIHGGMNFSSIKLAMGEQFIFNQCYEFAAVLLTGRITFAYSDITATVERTDYFKQPPSVLHCPAKTEASVTALTDCELLLIETTNNQSFAPMLFDPQSLLELDHRGKDLLDDTSYRHVRTVFDKRNRSASNLVVGEIISMPGRWSSYPPHYHTQPEIYHYRFSEPLGFCFGEHGEKVIRIEHNDTYQILQGGEHAHCVAPGYALYTLWFIRHLPGDPYYQPTFRDEHAWTRSKEANLRVWS